MKEILLENLRKGIPTVHFSIDDCILGLQEAFSQFRDSLFESDYFGFLRRLHEETGVETTSFLFYENKGIHRFKSPFNLSMTDSMYQQEFIQNPWLKFQVHAKNRQTPMTCQTSNEVLDTINLIDNALYKFAGKENVATAWRPHYFAAGRDACDLMRQRSDVLLTADDQRKIVACLSPDVVKRMWNGGVYDDKESGFLLLHSSFRVEDPQLSLEDMKLKMDKDISIHGICSFYTHEYELVMSGGYPQRLRDKTRNLLKYAKEKGYKFIN